MSYSTTVKARAGKNMYSIDIADDGGAASASRCADAGLRVNSGAVAETC